jgi:hypothetical protein
MSRNVGTWNLAWNFGSNSTQCEPGSNWPLSPYDVRRNAVRMSVRATTSTVKPLLAFQ